MEKKEVRKGKVKFPNFGKMTYKEEAEWWDTHDLGDYWDEMKDVNIHFALQRPKDATVVVRVQNDVKERLERVARRKGINISALARMWLLEKLQSGKR